MIFDKLEIGFTVDWVNMVFIEGEAVEFAREMGYGEYNQVKAVPPKGYNHAIELESGLRIATHTERKEMGTLFQFTGSCLVWYRSTEGTDWHDILRIGKHCNGRSSRVDLAIDVKNSELKLVDLCKPNLVPYKGKGRTPKYLPVGTQEDGWTVYVGSRQSEKYLRVYDKAKEQGWIDTDYVRIELECKGQIAHAIGWEFPQMERKGCVDMAKTLIRTVAHFKLPVWEYVMSSDDVTLTLPKQSDRDTMGWLVRICAPALAKQIAKKPSQRILEDFWDALRMALVKEGVDVPGDE